MNMYVTTGSKTAVAKNQHGKTYDTYFLLSMHMLQKLLVAEMWYC